MADVKEFSNSRSKMLSDRGIKWTKIYLITLIGGIPVLAFFGIVRLEQLSLNELGDFLAGAFGPLALFWLVLGFFQQGEELQNSVEALKLQAEELKNAVDQQKELVAVSRESMSWDKELRRNEEESKKRISIRVSYSDTVTRSSLNLNGLPLSNPFHKFNIYNIENELFGVNITSSYGECYPNNIAKLEKGSLSHFYIDEPTITSFTGSITICIEGRDRFDEIHMFDYSLHVDPITNRPVIG